MEFPPCTERKIDSKVHEAIHRAVASEPFAQRLKMKLVELECGRSLVEMNYEKEAMDNIFGRTHGGAIFALIDEAFETAAQSEGTIAVALNVSVTYVSCPETGAKLQAEARQVSRTKKTAGYDIRVTDQDGRLIATCQALAYRTGKPLDFL